MMINILKKITLTLSLLLITGSIFASSNAKLSHANTDINNIISLQNGAKLFFNYCSGCHAIEFMRYQRIADDLKIDPTLVKKDFMFTNKKIAQTISTAMRPDDAINWFGAVVPDLSLTARSRGIDWIYSYLRGFYLDSSRPFGVNNHILIGASMPDVLSNRKKKLSQAEFDSDISDITNFLDYVSEPIQLQRKNIGINVLIFLTILLILSYLLKKEYWKDVKYGQWKAKK